ncbi:MAG TPA: DUF4136 domain-containing protein [Candidatus Angelobacter sp.]
MLILFAGLAFAQKIKTGYDKSADFSGFKTYAWTQQQPSPIQPLVATLIVADIDHELAAKGLRKVEKDPDVLVSYYAGGDAQSAFAQTDPGNLSTGGIPTPNATMWTGSLPATALPPVVKGTLIIDLADARKQRLVWRGSGEAKLDYEKRSKIYDTVNKVIPEMFKDYPPATK